MSGTETVRESQKGSDELMREGFLYLCSANTMSVENKPRDVSVICG